MFEFLKRKKLKNIIATFILVFSNAITFKITTHINQRKIQRLEKQLIKYKENDIFDEATEQFKKANDLCTEASMFSNKFDFEKALLKLREASTFFKKSISALDEMIILMRENLLVTSKENKIEKWIIECDILKQDVKKELNNTENNIELLSKNKKALNELVSFFKRIMYLAISITKRDSNTNQLSIQSKKELSQIKKIFKQSEESVRKIKDRKLREKLLKAIEETQLKIKKELNKNKV